MHGIETLLRSRALMLPRTHAVGKSVQVATLGVELARQLVNGSNRSDMNRSRRGLPALNERASEFTKAAVGRVRSTLCPNIHMNSL